MIDIKNILRTAGACALACHSACSTPYKLSSNQTAEYGGQRPLLLAVDMVTLDAHLPLIQAESHQRLVTQRGCLASLSDQLEFPATRARSELSLPASAIVTGLVMQVSAQATDHIVASHMELERALQLWQAANTQQRPVVLALRHAGGVSLQFHLTDPAQITLQSVLPAVDVPESDILPHIEQQLDGIAYAQCSASFRAFEGAIEMMTSQGTLYLRGDGMLLPGEANLWQNHLMQLAQGAKARQLHASGAQAQAQVIENRYGLIESMTGIAIDAR